MKKLANIFSRPDNSIPEIPKAERLKSILDEHLSSALEKIGLKEWDGNYNWHGEFNTHEIKPVFKFVRLKGLSGTFQFGNCFKFLPTISGKGDLMNHQSDKSTQLQLFERTDGWHNSFMGSKLTDTVSLWNEREFEETLIQLRDKYFQKVQNWHSDNSSLEKNILTAENQLKIGGAYNTHWPSQSYVLSFLHAFNRNEGESKHHLEEFMSANGAFNDELKNQIILKLEQIKTDYNKGS